jgi:hypothetical protein
MRPARTLKLRTEHLGDLTPDELQSVVGAVATNLCTRLCDSSPLACLTVQPRCF